jgi:hypothetical protein
MGAAADVGAVVVTAGAAMATATGAAAEVVGTATPEEGGVGKRTVGAAAGFGGKLMRTVSFLGCTFAASPDLGGTAPEGKLGMFSAINYCAFKLKFTRGGVKPLFGDKKAGWPRAPNRLQSRST